METRARSRITHDDDKEQARSLDLDAEDSQIMVQSPILVDSGTPGSSIDSPVMSAESRDSELVTYDLFQGQEKLSESRSQINLTCTH